MPLKVQNLTHLLADLWNKTVKRGTAARASQISEDDIVVFVVGPTGSGKSWFTREATKSDLISASKDHHPSTEEVQAVRCELTDEAKVELKEGVKSIVFVDTPSFLTESDRFDARKEIEGWISQTKFKPLYAGVIYMHRVETNPDYEPIQNHLKELSFIPHIRDRCFQRLRIVISHDEASSQISEDKIAERKSKLCSQAESLKGFYGSKCKAAVHQKLFQGEPDVAWEAIGELFRN